MTAALIVLAVLAAVQLPLEAWAGRERRRLRVALAEHAAARDAQHAEHRRDLDVFLVDLAAVVEISNQLHELHRAGVEAPPELLVRLWEIVGRHQ